VAQLCQYQDELKKLNTEVWVISFGTVEMAMGWMEDTCAPFTMLLDEERKVYQGYGMRHSWWRSWNVKTLWFYTKALLTGHKLHGLQGDGSQLGGDFIVNRDGTLLLSHPSASATDRPPVKELLKILRQTE
jgi:hypothetical protein